MICIDAENLQDGLYNIKNGKIYKYKAKGGTVRAYKLENRPQGEWKSVKASIYPYGYDVKCSICGHRTGSSFGYKFCPMCGAKMKGATDGNK